MVGAIINRPRQGSFDLLPGHCEPVTDVTGVAIRFPTAVEFQVSTAFSAAHRTKGPFV